MVDFRLMKFLVAVGIAVAACLISTASEAQQNLDQRASELLSALAKHRPNGPNTDHLLPPFDDIFADRNLPAMREREQLIFRKAGNYRFMSGRNVKATQTYLGGLIDLVEIIALIERNNTVIPAEKSNEIMDNLLNLSEYIRKGTVFNKNSDLADKLLYEAARRGHADSQSRLCSNLVLKHTPENLPKADLDTAWFFCQKATDQGQPTAILQMALMHYRGDGHAKADPELAIKLLETVIKIGGPMSDSAKDALQRIGVKPSSSSLFVQGLPSSSTVSASSRRVFSSMISAPEHQRLFDGQLREKYYPVSVVGTCQNGRVLYQSEFLPFDPAPFAFRSVHGVDGRTFRRVQTEMDRGQFTLLFQNETDCGGRRHIHATWTKGLVAAPSTSVPRSQSLTAAAEVAVRTGSMSEQEYQDFQNWRVQFIERRKKTVQLLRDTGQRPSQYSSRIFEALLSEFDAAVTSRNLKDANKLKIELLDAEIDGKIPQRFQSQPDLFDCRKMWEEMIALADLSAEILKKGKESREGVTYACQAGWPALKERRAVVIADLEKHKHHCEVDQKLINVAKASQRTTSRLQQEYCR